MSIPCYTESWSCPVQFVEGRGNLALSSSVSSQLAVTRVDIFPQDQQVLLPFHPMMIFQILTGSSSSFHIFASIHA